MANTSTSTLDHNGIRRAIKKKRNAAARAAAARKGNQGDDGSIIMAAKKDRMHREVIRKMIEANVNRLQQELERKGALLIKAGTDHFDYDVRDAKTAAKRSEARFKWSFDAAGNFMVAKMR